MAVATLWGVYLIAGAINLFGGAVTTRLFEQWRYPGLFRRVTGALELLSAALLSFPATRLFGVAMAGIIGFFSVVTLLNHRQYGWSVPAMLLLAAVVPAALAQS